MFIRGHQSAAFRSLFGQGGICLVVSSPRGCSIICRRTVHFLIRPAMVTSHSIKDNRTPVHRNSDVSLWHLTCSIDIYRLVIFGGISGWTIICLHTTYQFYIKKLEIKVYLFSSIKYSKYITNLIEISV